MRIHLRAVIRRFAAFSRHASLMCRLIRRTRGTTLAGSLQAALLALIVTAHGSRCDAQELRRAVSIVAENDYFDFWQPPDHRSDDNYTQGARIRADVGGAPQLFRRAFCVNQGACGSMLEMGQEMYTPTVDRLQPVPGDRPYAGWLYLRGSVVAATGAARRTVSMTVGVTGPPSLAAQAQEEFHHLVHGFRRPLGWSAQLPTEIAFAAQGGADRYFSASARSGRWIDFVPSAHATLGTLRTAIEAGGQARVGFDLSHPWLRERRTPRFEAYVLLGTRAEAVARDLFLDGSTFRRSVHVTREPVVGAWERGVGVRFSRLGVEYRATTTSREYITGPHAHSYGGITMSWWTAP